MKIFDSFYNKYSVLKTLQFSLIPVYNTEENFEKRMILNEEDQRTQAYDIVKKCIDRYHKAYIDDTLSTICLEDVDEYAEVFFKKGKNEKETELLKKLEEKMRKQIAKAFEKNKNHKAIFDKPMITELLPAVIVDEEEKAALDMFKSFSTYFKGFSENRKNIYKAEISNSVPYRCINDNLPKYLDNILVFEKIVLALDACIISELSEQAQALCGFSLEFAFDKENYGSFMSQKGIDLYNSILGGYTCSDGTKVQGINEHINLYNQQIAKNDKSRRLPQLKPLYKQILSEHETFSFVIDQNISDEEIVKEISETYNCEIKTAVEELAKLFEDFDSFDTTGVYCLSGIPATRIANGAFGRWSAISDSWNCEYEEKKPRKKNKDYEEYCEERRKAYNKIKSFSLKEMQNYGEKNAEEGCLGNIVTYFKMSVASCVGNITKYDLDARELLQYGYDSSSQGPLCKNEKAISQIKNLFDSIKELEHLVKPLLGTGKEESKDEIFYGRFSPLVSDLCKIDRIYDKTRNHITKKPYSKEKVKLNFGNPDFLSGWAKNQEIAKSAQIFFGGENEYYIGVIDSGCRDYFRKGYRKPASKEDIIMKMCYEQMASASKDIPNLMFINGVAKKVNGKKDADGVNRRLEQAKNENLPAEVNALRLKYGYAINKNTATEEEFTTFINYYKSAVEAFYSNFKFNFKPTEEYISFKDFCNDVNGQAYQINYEEVSLSHVRELVESGCLYLFRIYNKDFSSNKKKHGTDNLHTMYFKMLFDSRNLSDVVYQLNGGAEMFYRRASIKKEDRIIHTANQPVQNKNKDNEKKTSLFEYDIVKDRRFTERQFSLHLPITLNFKAEGKERINNDVRQAIKASDELHVIGIDRGERNLVYISVINSKGEIVEQKSLNEICSGNGYKTDYHNLLDKKKKELDNARKSWGTIENIKELKEGYISQVVNEVCRLVLKYDAIIAMEDLNFGFKKGRIFVEKQVYQKFENMLLSKLNFLVDKHAPVDSVGGLLKARQLTNKVDGVNRERQNGIVFFVPAYLTSKIDPTTGFIDLLKPRYSSVKDSIELVNNMDDIRFNEKENIFEFDIDYSRFPRGSSSYRKKWTLCSFGNRIETFRNSSKNNEIDTRTIDLTEEFKKLFEEYSVDITGEIKEEIASINQKDFHFRFIRLLSLMLQMRNSEIGNVDVDYIISPVKNSSGGFYDSSKVGKDEGLPIDADANGAYNIARKALWAVDQIKTADESELGKVNIYMKNTDWLEYVQK